MMPNCFLTIRRSSQCILVSKENNVFVTRFEILKEQPHEVFLKENLKLKGKHRVMFISHLRLIFHIHIQFTFP